jgi:hypothetical protein
VIDEAAVTGSSIRIGKRRTRIPVACQAAFEDAIQPCSAIWQNEPTLQILAEQTQLQVLEIATDTENELVVAWIDLDLRRNCPAAFRKMLRASKDPEPGSDRQLNDGGAFDDDASETARSECSGIDIDPVWPQIGHAYRRVAMEGHCRNRCEQYISSASTMTRSSLGIIFIMLLITFAAA